MRRASRWLRRVSAVLVLAVVGIGVWIYCGAVPQAVRSPSELETTAVLLDRSGRPLDGTSARLLRVQGSSGSQSPSRRARFVAPSLAARAAKLRDATVAAEDQRFMTHPGVDAVAISRAALADLRARHVVQGGSTITQQLVKLRLSRAETHRRGVAAKFMEGVYAVRLDRAASKDEILSAYLAEAPYGGRVIGAEDAARSYFDTTVSQLTWAQAAYLAALPQRPTRFNPARDPRAAVARQQWILGRLRSEGTIDESTYIAAKSERIDVALRPVADSVAPHVVELIRAQLEKPRPALRTLIPFARSGTAAKGPLPAVEGRRRSANLQRTSIDLSLQRAVAGIAKQRRRELAAHGASNVSVVVIDNETGAIRAWEGSGAYGEKVAGAMINGPLQRRQTGSTIKPFIYALAFDDGKAPSDLIDDSPFVRPGANDDFRPENYDRKFRGTITLREALASSINIPAVKLLADYGAPALVKELARAGVEVPGGSSANGLALAVGTGQIDLIDLTSAYSAIARGGKKVEPTFAPDGLAEAESAAVMSPGAAFLLADVLSDNDARAAAFGRQSALLFPFPVAAKTGTSQNFHDNWVVGFTPAFTVGVWVGNFDRTALRGATGVTGAGPIFHDVVLAAHDLLTPGWGVDETAAIAEMPDTVEEVPDVSASRTARSEYRWRSNTLSGSTGEGRAASSALRLALIEPRSRVRYVIDPTVPLATQRLTPQASGGTPPYRFSIVDTSSGREMATSGPRFTWGLVAGSFKACVVDSTSLRMCTDFRVE